MQWSAALDDVARATCEAFICDLYPAVKNKLAVQTNCDMSCFVRSDTRANSYIILQTVCSSMQVFIWRNALVARPHLPFSEGNGWEKINGILCSLAIWRKQQHQTACLNVPRANVDRGVKVTVLVSTSDCLVLKLVFPWQTWTCAKIHMVHFWTQAMNLRTILTVRLINWSENDSYQFSYIPRYKWPGSLWCLVRHKI